MIILYDSKLCYTLLGCQQCYDPALLALVVFAIYWSLLTSNKIILWWEDNIINIDNYFNKNVDLTLTM